MPYIKSQSGISWRYILRGKAKDTLLFIHGWAGDSSVWYRQLDYFSDRFKTVCLDLPGHGKSNWQDIKFDSLIDDILFICRELELKNVAVFGLSFGGQIAIELVLKSKFFKKLILVDSSPKFIKGDGFKTGLSLSQVRKLSKQLDDNFPNILVVFARSLFTDKEREKEIFANTWDVFIRRKSFPKKETLKKMLVMIENIDLRDGLSKIKIPTLIISGEKDYICPLCVAEFLNKNITNSELRVIKECGHMPLLTEPDIFNKIIDGFLSEDDR